ncbi:hypothetical protein DL767_002333 [Monosporascus sp. MG133]|nr:hypothetical protein DL767_002333 [Monosporascus sp. MG133]
MFGGVEDANCEKALEAEQEPHYEPIHHGARADAQEPTRTSSKVSAARRPSLSTLSSVARVRSQNGHGCDDLEESGGPEDMPSRDRPELEKDSFEVSWDGDDDPMCPRSLPLFRKWAMVVIVGMGSFCVSEYGAPIRRVYQLPYALEMDILYPIKLREKARALRKETGDDRWKAPMEKSTKSIARKIGLSLLRPFQLLIFEPMCLLLCVFSAILLGVLYLFFGAFGVIFGDNYGFNLWQTGLSFLGIFVGMILCSATDPLWRLVHARLIQRNKGVPEPEFRLPPAIAGAVLVPVGLFWFAWTTYPHVHWIMPIIGSGIFGTGMLPALGYFGKPSPFCVPCKESLTSVRTDPSRLYWNIYISWFWGYIAGWLNPFKFYRDQVPQNPIHDWEPQGQILTLMTVNLFGVMIMSGLICCWSTYPDIVRKYTVMMIITDIGHTYSVYRGVGIDYFWDPSQWNAHNWLNIGMCMFLLAHRVALLFGGLGRLEDNTAIAKKTA